MSQIPGLALSLASIDLVFFCLSSSSNLSVVSLHVDFVFKPKLAPLFELIDCERDIVSYGCLLLDMKALFVECFPCLLRMFIMLP